MSLVRLSGRALAGRWRRLAAMVQQGGLVTANDAPARRLRLEQEALALLAKGSRAIGFSALVGMPLGAWLLAPFVGPLWAWIPALLVLLATAERFVFLRALERAAQAPAKGPSDEGAPAQGGERGGVPNPRTWAWRIVWRSLLVGCLLNGWSYAAAQSPEFMAAIYILAIALMVATSAMTQLCVWPAAVWAYITPVLLGLGWHLWSVGDVHGDGRLAGGIFLIVLWVMLLAATQRFAANMQRELRTRLHNEELVAELDAKRRQAEAASAAKSRFLAAASHDLRQPVHAMSLLGETLRERLAPTEHAPLMHQMLTGVELFSQLVDEVMDLARVDASGVGAQMDTVPVRELLERAETAFRSSAKSRGLALWLRLPEGCEPLVHADAALTWRVLSNLMSNAVRYTPRGGVMLAVRRARLHGKPAWRLEVRDSGPGIAEHQREAIFEEFYRAHDAHRTSGEGHGLGLAVARRMAQLMGTTVRLHPASRWGAGAVFSISLEAAERVPAHAATNDDASPWNGSRQPAAALPRLTGCGRVLVVEDDPLARDALRLLLADWGVRVDAATSPREAEALARQAALDGAPVEVLVTDHWLADGESSADVLAAVRPHAPGLRIAVVSGGAGVGDEHALRAQGITFWRKPLHPAVLHAWLRGDAVSASPSWW